MTAAPAQIALTQTAKWNEELTNPYRTRWAEAAGRYFKVSSDSLEGMWDVEEVNESGEYVDYIAAAFTLAAARKAIAGTIKGERK